MSDNPKIFISYRRTDSAPFAGRISDTIVQRYGDKSVFVDVDAIPLGASFEDVLRRELEKSDILLAVIGPNWFAEDESGNRRIDNPNDFVRLEIEAALAQGKPVVPVLVSDAQMPSRAQLPASLQQLANRHAAILSHRSFHSDMDRLLHAIEGLASRAANENRASESTPDQPTLDIDVSSFDIERVFISHATLDRSWVEGQIIEFLESNGVQTWYAKTAISSASQWEREILRGLHLCDWFLLVVSPAASKSEWVKDELNWAFYHRQTKIIPVIYKPCNLWDFHLRLPRLQYVDFSEDISAGQTDLIRTFLGDGA